MTFEKDRGLLSGAQPQVYTKEGGLLVALWDASVTLSNVVNWLAPGPNVTET